ncbi:MAG: thiamine pyrophosphate-dependent dehydrogenase E1 component subunit alpha [Candidatus Dormibacteria bacterium]
MVVANRAVRAIAGIDADTLRAMYRHMLRSRMLDERIWLLNRQGLVRFWVSGMGQEAIQVALGMQVRPGIDWVAPYYRDLALTLTLGMTPRDHLLAAMAKADDPNTGGRQMPAHFGCRRLHIITTGSVVATQFIHAAGIALASRMRGEDAVTVVTTGEGATSEGDFHEALNFAATHRLAVVFVVEDNGLAISVPTSKQMPTANVSDRAAGYGIPGVVVDGTDPVASHLVCREAVARARAGQGPTLIDAKVPRLTSHSSDDDQRRYRTAEALESDRTHDCLGAFATRLREQGLLSAKDEEAMRAELLVEMDVATAEAEAAADPDPATVLLHVLGDA